MSTFDGRIKEYPAISIDNFVINGFAKYYLLSHVHSDHLRGLDENFRRQIYCSKQSAKLLPLLTFERTNRPKYAHLEKFLVPIPYNKRYTITTPEYEDLHFTFLPANHCLGSSLILIECKRKGTVLYSGDIRAEVDFVERELQVIKQHRIQNLYMDTTCCYKDRMNYISKKKSSEQLIKKMKALNDYHHIYLDFWQLGYEELWRVVYDTFKMKIHVSEERYKLYCAADPTFADILTTDSSGTRFHSCNWGSDCSIHGKYTIAFHPRPSVNQEITVYTDKYADKLLKSDLPNKVELKQQLFLPFSTHSSCSEIVAFHKFVRPKLFTPCVVRGDFYERASEFKDLLVQLGCEIGDVQFSAGSSYSSCHSYSKKQKSSLSGSSSVYSKTLSDVESWSPESSCSAGMKRTQVRTPLLVDTTNRNTQRSPLAARSSVHSPKERNSQYSQSAKSGERNSQRSRQVERNSQTSQGSVPVERRSQRSQSAKSIERNSQRNSQRSRQVERNSQNSQRSNTIERSSQISQRSNPIQTRTQEARVEEYGESLNLSILSQYSIPVPPVEEEQENCIVISSDDEDDINRPLLTKDLFRQFKRKLKQCKYFREEPEEISVSS